MMTTCSVQREKGLGNPASCVHEDNLLILPDVESMSDGLSCITDPIITSTCGLAASVGLLPHFHNEINTVPFYFSGFHEN